MSTESTDSLISGCQDKISDNLLDLKHLSNYTLGNKSLEHEILASFKDRLKESYASMCSSNDISSWHDILHSLKGTSANVGAFRLYRAVEHASKIPPSLFKKYRSDALAAIGLCVEDLSSHIGSILADKDKSKP